MNISACIKLFLISVFCLVAVSCCSVSEERAFYSKRMRLAHDMLVDNLKRFVSGDPGLSFQRDQDLNIDFLVKQLEFRSQKTINHVGLLSRTSRNEKNNLINARLSEINEHFIFKEDWFNELFYIVIRTRIPVGTKSTDPEIYDYIELLTADYILERNDHGINIPRHLHLAILSFIHLVLWCHQLLMSISIA